MKKILDWDWLEYREVGSTNDEALRYSAEADGRKFVVTAETQTNGRGRRGRSWIGLDGNLFMSLGVEAELRWLGAVNFIAGLSLLETIKQISPNTDVKLKWPNDVLIDGCKVSGILLEKGAGDYLIIGIGVNIAAAPDDEGLIYKTTSLHNSDIYTDRTKLLEHYIQVFDNNLKEWHRFGFGTIKERWLENAKGVGEKISVHLEHEQKDGIFYGVDENASLLLKTGNKIEKIYAGDVFYAASNRDTNE